MIVDFHSTGQEQRTAVPKVLEKLDWMRRQGIWPNGKRYLWTDAFGVVLLVSLYHETGNSDYLDEAERVVGEVYRVLGRPRGLRIGEAADRYGQYYHYLAMWMYALAVFGEVRPQFRQLAIRLVKEIHPVFVIPGQGVIWKMQEDLRGPDPLSGWGGLDPFHGYVVYRLLDDVGLEHEIDEMHELMQLSYRDLSITQDLGLGMMLWFTHFHPTEPWARIQRQRCLENLDRLWRETPGYFARDLRGSDSDAVFAFTNYGVAIGLRAVRCWPERVRRVNAFFRTYRSGDHYDTDAITHVMECSALLPGRLIRPALWRRGRGGGPSGFRESVGLLKQEGN
jgi:hypothetical protein